MTTAFFMRRVLEGRSAMGKPKTVIRTFWKLFESQLFYQIFF